MEHLCLDGTHSCRELQRVPPAAAAAAAAGGGELRCAWPPCSIVLRKGTLAICPDDEETTQFFCSGAHLEAADAAGLIPPDSDKLHA